ncbi:MAG: hypothetical protein KKB34_15845 [Bacteroidetes bacterium]|nr:hypothetical protein [Bacteroidota bacterium]
MLVSVFPNGGSDYTIIAKDGLRSAEITCKSNLIIANLFILKIKFLVLSLIK